MDYAKDVVSINILLYFVLLNWADQVVTIAFLHNFGVSLALLATILCDIDCPCGK